MKSFLESQPFQQKMLLQKGVHRLESLIDYQELANSKDVRKVIVKNQ